MSTSPRLTADARFSGRPLPVPAERAPRDLEQTIERLARATRKD